MQQVVTDQPQQMFAWVRQEGGNKVLGLFNLSGRPVSATFADALPAGTYKEFRSADGVTLAEGDTVTLPEWGFRLLAISNR
jgi:hypothetical protein